MCHTCYLYTVQIIYVIYTQYICYLYTVQIIEMIDEQSDVCACVLLEEACIYVTYVIHTQYK